MTPFYDTAHDLPRNSLSRQIHIIHPFCAFCELLFGACVCLQHDVVRGFVLLCPFLLWVVRTMATSSLTAPHGPLVGVKIVDLQWSIEIVLSSSILRAKNLNATPLVTLCITLEDGRVLSFRLTQSELHQWRYTIARACKDLAYLDRKKPPAPTSGAARGARGNV